MKSNLLNICLLLIVLFGFNESSAQQRVTFPSKDGLEIRGDWYFIGIDAPTMILCHQAGYSRGEYIQTGRRFNKLGFNCLAIDLRSGGSVFGVKNETAELARKKNKSTSYLDAEQDIIAAIEYVYGLYRKKVILVGSSYSASLALKIAKENDNVYGVLSFSPGEYFGNKLFVQKAIGGLSKPMYVASSKSESSNVSTLIKEVTANTKVQFTPSKEGAHGSKALWRGTDGNQEYWMSLIVFSQKLLKMQ